MCLLEVIYVVVIDRKFGKLQVYDINFLYLMLLVIINLLDWKFNNIKPKCLPSKPKFINFLSQLTLFVNQLSCLNPPWLRNIWLTPPNNIDLVMGKQTEVHPMFHPILLWVPIFWSTSFITNNYWDTSCQLTNNGKETNGLRHVVLSSAGTSNHEEIQILSKIIFQLQDWLNWQPWSLEKDYIFI